MIFYKLDDVWVYNRLEKIKKLVFYDLRWLFIYIVNLRKYYVYFSSIDMFFIINVFAKLLLFVFNYIILL